MRAWFDAVAPVDAEVVRPYDLGGGRRADPDEPPENLFHWAPADGLLVSAAGLGSAVGHAGIYLDAAPLARAFVDAVAASGSARSLVDAVREGAAAVAAIAARAPVVHGGNAVEGCALRFHRAGRLELAQAGAQALFRRRDAATDRLIRTGTLGDERPDIEPGLARAPCRFITSRGEISTGIHTCDLDWRVGDRFLVTTRGVHTEVDAETLAACLALPPEDILPAVVAAARRAPGRRSNHPAAAMVVVEAA